MQQHDANSDQVKIYFYADGKLEPLPDSVLKGLKSVPVEEFDDGIIDLLIASGLYQDATVEHAQSTDKDLVFIVRAASLKRIQDITLEGLSSADQINYRRFLSLQVGQIYSSSFLTSDAKKLQKELKIRGYPNAKVSHFEVTSTENHFVKISFEVDKGHACHIEQIVIENDDLNILNFLASPIEVGSLCSIPAIKDKLEVVKEKYFEKGYLQARAKIKDILYSKDNESAKVILQIDKGQKTTIQIVNEKNKFLDFDFFSANQAGLTYVDLRELSDSDLKELVVRDYQKKGYAFVKVTRLEKSEDKSGNFFVRFYINQGPFFKVGDVHFIGDFPEKKDKMLSDLGLSNHFFQDVPFDENQMPEYKDRIKGIFYNYGYLNAQVAEPDFSYPSNGNAVNLYFTADKGDRYIVSDIKVEGLPNKFDLNKENLDEIFRIGDTLNLDKRQAYEEEYRKQLLAAGYLYARVKIDQNILEDQTEEDVRLINWSVHINSGPIVHIRNVYAQGDLFNKEKTIISISGLETGDLFTQEHLENARTRLLRHDLFSAVAVEPLSTEALDHKEANIDVVIRTRGRSGFGLSLMPGYGTLRGYRVALDFTLNKITDHGLRLISNAGVSQELQQQNFATTDTKQILGQQLNLGLTESLFKIGQWETPLDVSAIAGYQVVAETLTNRQYQTLKLISEWKPNFFDKFWTLTTTLSSESSFSTSAESAIVQTIDSPSIRTIEFLNGLSLDTRNNNAWPTSGGIYSFQFGMARFGMGSEVEYNRYLLNADQFFPIYERLSGAISFGGTSVVNTVNQGGVTVAPPASKRATLTDDALIRGFPETFGSAAPGPLLWIHYANNGVPNCNTQLASVGGTNLIYLKSEARYRINDNFGAVLFLDTGESYFTSAEVNQVNNQIAQQIANGAPSTTQCVADNATLVSPPPTDTYNSNIFSQYWNQAYVSTGVGLRLILGNYATVNLDYGYPLKDPASNQSNCVSPTQAQNSNVAPTCITRIQTSTYLWGLLNFQGALHLSIGAKF